ncbi:hypothetical protein [Ventosimonas gracilis]|uniref:hypothetical protein n=1 Tax=Ventosimonas gracilis TaxID=1680762 RepID=UPI00128FBAE3|nr:hypothetical protein [Ventosimonas gracilis]
MLRKPPRLCTCQKRRKSHPATGRIRDFAKDVCGKGSRCERSDGDLLKAKSLKAKSRQKTGAKYTAKNAPRGSFYWRRVRVITEDTPNNKWVLLPMFFLLLLAKTHSPFPTRTGGSGELLTAALVPYTVILSITLNTSILTNACCFSNSDSL